MATVISCIGLKGSMIYAEAQDVTLSACQLIGQHPPPNKLLFIISPEVKHIWRENLEEKVIAESIILCLEV